MIVDGFFWYELMIDFEIFKMFVEWEFWWVVGIDLFIVNFNFFFYFVKYSRLLWCGLLDFFVGDIELVIWELGCGWCDLGGWVRWDGSDDYYCILCF